MSESAKESGRYWNQLFAQSCEVRTRLNGLTGPVREVTTGISTVVIGVTVNSGRRA